MHSPIHRILLMIFGGMLLAALILTAIFWKISMIAFQKTAMITPVVEMPAGAFMPPAQANRSALDVKALISAIPYENGTAIFDILPRDRFHKTIEMGYGNCSNLSFGVAYWLLLQRYPFQIVHLIPYDSFLSGKGHTLLNMPYQFDGAEQTGLVDVMEGGLPRVAGHYLDLSALQKKYLGDVAIAPLNPRKDRDSEYYGEFLNNAAVGIVNQEEIAQYFAFINRVYFSLGSKRLERVFFSGIAMVFGQYPRTYVTREEYLRLFGDKIYLPWMAQLLLWLSRMLLLMTIVSASIAICVAIKRSLSKWLSPSLHGRELKDSKQAGN